MKRILFVVPLMAVVTACGTTNPDPYDKRADSERQRREAQVQRSVEQAPEWMTRLPKSDSAVYANGTALSTDMGMSANKAKTMAFGKICMAAGGQVDQQSKMFVNDRTNNSTEMSELAIRSFGPGVDISGAEMVETRVIAEGTRFRTFVLMALPTGEANRVQTARDERNQRRAAEKRSDEAFREMDTNQSRAQ